MRNKVNKVSKQSKAWWDTNKGKEERYISKRDDTQGKLTNYTLVLSLKGDTVTQSV